MLCSQFCAQHLDWLDAGLTPSEARAMRSHADECARCARYDADLRMGMLLARHSTPLTVSAGFRTRLNERLAMERFAAAAPRRAGGGFSGRLTA